MRLELKTITTDSAPGAIGPYSQAVRAGDWLFVSGQIPMPPGGGAIPEEFGQQVKQVLANLQAILQAAGADFSRVVKVNVYLTDLRNFAELNEIYAAFFGAHRPARAVVQVAELPRGVKVEIEAVAAL